MIDLLTKEELAKARASQYTKLDVPVNPNIESDSIPNLVREYRQRLFEHFMRFPNHDTNNSVIIYKLMYWRKLTRGYQERIKLKYETEYFRVIEALGDGVQYKILRYPQRYQLPAGVKLFSSAEGLLKFIKQNKLFMLQLDVEFIPCQNLLPSRNYFASVIELLNNSELYKSALPKISRVLRGNAGLKDVESQVYRDFFRLALEQAIV